MSVVGVVRALGYACVVRPWPAVASFCLLTACASSDAAPDASALDAVVVDAAPDRDAFALPDLGRPDAGPRPDASMPGFGAPVALGTTGASLPETSGIVVSRTHAGVIWAENDSGNPPNVFAIDLTGALLATLTLGGATNVDWEDIALAPGPSGDVLYLADVGDNFARASMGRNGRTSVRLYRLPEPDPSLGDRTLSAETIDLRYPDHPHDCEAVLVEPTTGDVYLVSKEDAPPAEIFVARAPLAAGAMVTLEHLGSMDLALVTAADVSRDGAQVALRNYGEIRVYDVHALGIAAALGGDAFLTAPAASGAEAIAFDATDTDLLTIAEGTGATLYRIPRL